MQPVVNVNGLDYRWPSRPVAVVCIDGGDPAYLQRYLREGSIPNIARFMTQGYSVVAEGTVPSFTCPNNMSIITGTPASSCSNEGGRTCFTCRSPTGYSTSTRRRKPRLRVFTVNSTAGSAASQTSAPWSR